VTSLKIEKPGLRVFFLQLKKVSKNRKISLQTEIRILKGIVMTVIQYCSEAWMLRKMVEDSLDVFQKVCLGIAL
jgi:hypothetical protein